MQSVSECVRFAMKRLVSAPDPEITQALRDIGYKLNAILLSQGADLPIRGGVKSPKENVE